MFKKLLVHPTNHMGIQMIRYGFVVLIAAPIDVGGYILLVNLGLNIVLAATISFTTSMIVNYWLSVIWVFNRHSSKQKKLDAAIFFIIGLVGLGLTDLIVWFLTSGLSVNYLVAKFVALMIVFFWNFGARRILFHGWAANSISEPQPRS